MDKGVKEFFDLEKFTLVGQARENYKLFDIGLSQLKAIIEILVFAN